MRLAGRMYGNLAETMESAMKYTITLARKITETAMIDVEASTPDEAKALALNEVIENQHDNTWHWEDESEAPHVIDCELPVESSPQERIDYVVIEDDEDGLSELKQPRWENENLAYVVLQICGYRSGNPLPVTSIGDIDFYADADDWVRGTFTSIDSIPARCPHLRALASDLGLN